MINDVEVEILDWKIRIKGNGTRNQANRNKYNFEKLDGSCRIAGCSNTFRRNRTSGLCDSHSDHTHDLILTLFNPDDVLISVPTHQAIIDLIIKWTETRNYDLKPFFAQVSFTILGGIADVTSLGGDIQHGADVQIDTIDDVFNRLIEVTERHFPAEHTSSHQTLENRGTEFPAIVLIYTILGLLICEESNRGDRWFSRVVMKDEGKTSMLGAAMPIAYFASRSFPWGVELGKAAGKMIPSPY